MEPITMAGLFVVAVGGSMYFNAVDAEAPESAVAQVEGAVEVSSANPTFARGVFIRTDNGYYISNLSPQPIKAEGCDQPVLVADLSQPRSAEPRDVSSVMVNCEG